MKSSISLKLIASTMTVSLAASTAFAEPANQLSSLNGLNADGAGSALHSRGFINISSHKSSGGYVNSYWWDPQDRNCVMVEAYRNQVETITDARNSDCNQSNYSGSEEDSDHSGAKTAAAVAGVAILGALLAHKSHHSDDKDYDDSQAKQFDRGYQDGLHNAAYHNYDRSDAYSHGYEKGVDERQANVNHHYDRGGYNSVGLYKDLIGESARATEELGRRGFDQVDNFTSGDARYGIYWRSQSRQCLQAIISNGRIENISDIHSHPRCR